MLLSRLVFFSTRAWNPADEPVPGRHLEEILDAGRRNNPAAGISGVLVVDDNVFMQVLEGPRSRITTTFLRIAVDVRHKDVVLAGMEEISDRMFESWHVYMRRAPGESGRPAWFGAPDVETCSGFLERIRGALQSGDVLAPVGD